MSGLGLEPSESSTAPETPETESATSVTERSAVLSGLLNPSSPGEPGEYFFLYRTIEAEWMDWIVAPAPPGLALGNRREPKSVEVTGLKPSTKYMFRFVAKRGSRESLGEPETFETLPAPSASSNVSYIGNASSGRTGQVAPQSRPPAGLGKGVSAMNSRSLSRHYALTIFSVFVTALCSLAMLALATEPALAREAVIHSFSTSFGGPGSGNGQLALHEHSGVAVNIETGDVYVADTGNGRVEQFTSTGAFVRVFDGGTEPTFIAVDSTAGPSKGDVYVVDAATSTIAKFQADGTPVTSWGVSGRLDGSTAEEGPFSAEEGAIAGIAVDHSGNLWVYDTKANRLFGFNQEGVAKPTLHLERGTVPAGIAVDSVGNFYKVNGEPGVSKFGPSGGEEIGEVNSAFGGEGVTGLAFDPLVDDLYVDNGVGIAHFESSCQPVGGEHPCIPAETFGSPEAAGGELGQAAGLAVGPGHTVYVADTGKQRIDVFAGKTIVLPDVTTAAASSVRKASATLNGLVSPDETTITSCQFEYGTVESGEYAQTAPCSPATPAGKDPVPVTAEVSGLAPLTQYHYRLAVSNSNGAEDGTGVTFVTPAAPTIISESVSALNSSEPKLEAKINPDFQETRYRFEYATNKALTENLVVVPGAPPAALLPAVFEEVLAGPVGIKGLQGGMTYYYRVIAENQASEEAHKPEEGPVEEFVALGVPVVATNLAQESTRTSVPVSGSITPQGLATTYHFAYVPAAEYEESAANPYAHGKNTYETKLAEENGESILDYAAHPVTLTLEELQPGTTYDYALVANNELGTVVGPNQTFTTAAATPPVVTTGAAVGVSQLSATITGAVDTRGLQTAEQFEFGTTPYAGALLQATVGSSEGSVLGFSDVFNGELQPGVTYYYRAVASSEDGIVYGGEQSFTTPGFAAAFAPATVLPAIPYTSIGTLDAREAKEGKATAPTSKSLTRAEKLTKALRGCRAKGKARRKACERKAREEFGPAGKSG